MSGLIVFDGSTPVGIIETPQSLEWKRRYQALSTLTATVDLSVPGLPELDVGTVVGVSDRHLSEETFRFGLAAFGTSPFGGDGDSLTPNLVFVIEDLPERTLDGEGRDLLTITATEYGLSHATVCYPPPWEPPFSATESHHDVTGPAEDFLVDLVARNRGPLAPASRRVNALGVAPSQGRGASRKWRARFQPLHERLNEVAMASGLGWEVTFSPTAGEFTFRVREGVDRSAEVVVDLELDSATAQEWRRVTSEARNVALVAGQGEGEDRAIVQVFVGDTEPTGTDRREVFVDARDLEDFADLEPRGLEKLAELQGEDSITSDLYAFGPFRYRRDFDVGDLVRVRNVRFGLDEVIRVSEVSQERSAESYPVTKIELGRVKPTLSTKVRQEVTDRATARA